MTMMTVPYSILVRWDEDKQMYVATGNGVTVSHRSFCVAREQLIKQLEAQHYG